MSLIITDYYNIILSKDSYAKTDKRYVIQEQKRRTHDRSKISKSNIYPLPSYSLFQPLLHSITSSMTIALSREKHEPTLNISVYIWSAIQVIPLLAILVIRNYSLLLPRDLIIAKNGLLLLLHKYHIDWFYFRFARSLDVIFLLMPRINNDC